MKPRRMPMPIMIERMVNTFERGAVGDRSPYPIVVSVMTLKYSESRMLQPSTVERTVYRTTR